jgi:glycine/D-amino acid oxidase-like deaminating enzyme
MIRLILDPAEVPVWQETLEVFAATPGFAAHWLEPAAIYKLEPRLTSTILCGLVLEGNGVVDSFLYTTLLAQAATHYGAMLRTGNVCGVQHANGRVTGVLLDDDIVACDQAVFAMGPWTQAAEAWLNVPIPIAPQKGEIVRLTLPGPALTHDFMSQDVELFSRSGGQVWCGATEEWCGFDATPSVAARTLLLSKATALMPAIAEASLVQHTACLRPVAPDHLPIIGRAPGWNNVYLATGGAHKGILLSPVMGKAITDLITTGTTTLAIAPCAPERFTVASG